MNRSSLARRHLVIRRFAAIIVLILILLVLVQTIANGVRESIADIPKIINISIQLFAIINPLSVLPFFLMYTEGLTESNRSKIVHITSLFVFALVLTFALIGQLSSILSRLQFQVP